ncbi:MAG: LPS assembly protein LptD [Gammaproteobacteria bacterium]|nr:LPS assembly protein LptD [Gammaproteobacteria bacterium]
MRVKPHHLLAGLVSSILFASTAAAGDCPAPVPEQVPAPDAQARPSVAVQPPGSQPIDVSSDSASVTRAGDAELAGHVVVNQGDRSLRADSARYEAATESFQVEGSVEYRAPELRLKGESGTWGGETGKFTGTEFELPTKGARGRAQELAVDRKGDLKLLGVSFTTCPAGQEDWQLRASSIDIDRAGQQGTGRDVRIDFQGVPILYTPWISFPVGQARKSGFLFPTFGQSDRHGVELGVPYYFNLAPNYDLTLEPRLYSKRGIDLGAKFRYLTTSSRGKFTGDVLPSDDVANRDRAYARLEHVTDFLPDLRLTADLAQASDSAYFEDFALGPEGTSVTYLKRFARVDYRGQGWRFRGLVDDFQTIDETIDPLDRPYSRLPQLVLSGGWPLGQGGLRGDVDGELSWFQRNEGVTGARFDVEPRLSLPLRGAGYFIEPLVGFRHTQYNLRDTAPGVDDAPSRSLPLASLDAGLVFERDAGKKRVQTLEPRVLYTYVPYRDQASLPIFDSGLPDLDLVQLFRPNRYVGADRVGDANQLAAGLTTRLVERASGRQYLAATIGQAFYFETPKVLLPGERAGRNSSDVVGQLALTAYRNWSVDLGMQWAPDTSNTVRSLVNLQYRPSGDRVINLGYRYDEGSIEQWEASAAWPLGKSWQLYGRHVYSLRDKSALDTFLGFEYRACCWRARVYARKYVSSRTGQTDTSIALQLELNGLSSVGVPADAFLERSIRGYSRDPTPPLP